MQQEEYNYHLSLTGIRAIAAWLVFIHHFNFFKPSLFGVATFNFFAEMHIGVTIFFVLSGLLITMRYYDKAISGGSSFYNYMLKRFARIFPAFLLILTINFLWLLYKGQYHLPGDWKYYLGSVTFVRGFFSHFSDTLVPQSWSLTAEECFYISCPLIFLFLKKNIRNLFFIPLLLISAGLLLTWFFIEHPFHSFFEDIRFLFNFTFFGRCIEFFAGIAVALLYRKYRPQKTSGFKFTLSGAIVILLCVAGLSLFHTDEFYGDHHPAGIVINNLLLPVFGIALLFWGLITEENIISKFLSAPLMVLCGKSSYIFYLIHLGIFMSIFFDSVSHNPLLVFVYLNIVSVILYKGFERPVNYWLRRKFLKKELIISKT